MTLDEYLAHMDPELRAVYPMFQQMFQSFPKDAREARHLFESMSVKTPETDAVARQDLEIPGSAGGEPIPLRLYVPTSRTAPSGCVLWIHGGGWSVGSIDGDDRLCDHIAEQAQVVVVSIGYRLAPEHPFPAGLTDCYDALQWVAQQTKRLGIDPGRIAVGGASAGGNLSAALALMARDRSGPSIAFQLLIYPCVLDSRLQTPSTHAITTPGMALNRDAVLNLLRDYVGDSPEAQASPYLAPLLAKSLSGLPPAYLMVGGLDIVLDEGIDYAARLMQAGVRVELHVYPGAFHGFDILVPTATVSRRATAEYVRAVRDALAEPVGGAT